MNVLDKKIIAIILIFISISCDTNKVVNENVFRYNEYSNISSLDPVFSSTLRNILPCNQLFNGLVKMDENLNVVPDLAEYWTVSNDKKEYTFKIRDDVYFHESNFFKNGSVDVFEINDLTKIVNSYKDTEICSILVEAGPKLVNSFLKERIVDELIVYTSPKKLGEKGINWFYEDNAIENYGFKLESSYKIDSDTKQIYIKDE